MFASRHSFCLERQANAKFHLAIVEWDGGGNHAEVAVCKKEIDFVRNEQESTSYMVNGRSSGSSFLKV